MADRLQMKNLRVALYGGSFDPPHVGHEALARMAVARLALNRLLVIPALMPVHRALSGCVDGATKMAWLQAIWADEPRIAVKGWEVARPTPTIDTLRHFASRYRGVVPLLLLGSDAAAGIDKWIGYPKHRRLCNLAVCHRQGVDAVLPDGWKPLSEEAWMRTPNRHCGCVLPVDCSLPEVSASMVRQTVLRGGDIRGMVHDSILEDIRSRYDFETRGEGSIE